MLTLCERVQKHRNSLRNAGLRPMQVWVYDTKRPNFLDECKKQCRLASEADKVDDINQLLDAAINDIDGWVS